MHLLKRMHFVAGLCVAASVVGVLIGAPAWAQESTERGERGIVISPAQNDTDDTAIVATPALALETVLPPIPEKLPGGPLASTDQITVHRIIIEGSTVLDDAEVTLLTGALENRPIGVEDLHDLRHRLSEMYLQRGYVNSGVVLPDQRIDDGVIRLQAVEGSVTRLVIVGNTTLRDSYLEKRIRRGIASPLNSNDLQRALKILQADSRVRQINARLLPGSVPGESVLHVNVVENTNHWVRTALDNYRSPSVDENRFSLSAGNRNFTGNGDILVLEVGATKGLDDLDVYYSFPLTATDLRIAAYYTKTDSAVVEEPFNVIDITSDSETRGLSLSRPFRSDSGRLLTATLGLENREVANSLLDMPFSFTPGEVDGASEVSVAYLSGEWLWQTRERIIGVVASARFGVDLFDPTIQASAPDSRFTALRFQFQYARTMNWRDSQFIVRSSAQFTSDSLLALEKFAVGGHTTVRGYRENTLVRDNGIVASLEMQFPLFVDEEGRERFNLQVAPFIDYGIAWDSDNSLRTSHKDDLVSVGVGIRWRPLPGWTVRADYGYALTDVVTPTETLQDKGLQFRIEYTMTPFKKN